MNPKCSSCARFKKADSFPTCKACRGLAADRVLGCDKHGLKVESELAGDRSGDRPVGTDNAQCGFESPSACKSPAIPDSATVETADMTVTGGKGTINADGTFTPLEAGRWVVTLDHGNIVAADLVHPFVAAGHDLQPRRRFPWRKRR